MLPHLFNRTILCVSILGAAVALSACGGGGSGFADETTASRTASVRNGEVRISLDYESNGSVSNSRADLVAYVSGIDTDEGQIVTAAGI